MGTRYVSVIAIETTPHPDPAKHSDIVERLSCGHIGINHGPTWAGTDAPLHQNPAQYAWLVGKKRRCRECGGAA